jgi:hypothetical protein
MDNNLGRDMPTLAAAIKAYNPRNSPDNRADEMPLDLAIAKAVGVADDDWQVARGSVTGYFSGDGNGGFGNPMVPRYTTSVDDALTLAKRLPGLLEIEGGFEPDCPEAWPAWTVRWYPRGLSGKDWHASIGSAATLPLALCVTVIEAIGRDQETRTPETPNAD